MKQCQIQWYAPTIALIVILVQGALAQVQFTKIADTTTTIPGSASTFSTFGYAIMPSSGLMFYGAGGGGSFGYYQWSGGTLTALLSQATTVPGLTNHFLGLDSDNFTARTNTLFFAGSYRKADNTLVKGIYSKDSSGLTRIIETTGTYISPSDFTTFGQMRQSSENKLLFTAVNKPNGQPPIASGIYAATVSGGSATISSVLPTSDGTGASFDVNSQTLAYERRQLDSQDGIYTMNLTGGSLMQVVSISDPAPGTSGTFNYYCAGNCGGFIEMIIQGGKLAFYADYSAPNTYLGEGIFLCNEDGTSRECIFNSDMVAPGGTNKFTGHLGDSNILPLDYKDGLLVFEATTGGQPGVYYWRKGKLGLIVRPGDMLNGKTVYAARFRSEGVRGNQAVIRVTFTDFKDAIYLVTVPPWIDTVRQGANLMLSWPGSYTLQANSTLKSNTWVNLPNTSPAPISMTSSNQFFRLMGP